MKYDAFISYRHADLDMYIAKKLHKGLETFRVPRAVAQKSGKKNIKRVFRDQEELPIGSDLGDNIRTALADSEYLLVICSPRTPESYWVQEEISTFIQMHGRNRVLAVLIEGEPNESFPSCLLSDDEGNPIEPLAADVRGAAKREINKKLKSEIMRLAAPLLSCSYDDLRQRHRERRIKKLAAISGAVATLAVAFGVYSTYNAALIRQNYDGKQCNQSKYLADSSLSLLEEGDRRAAVLVALEALPSDKNDRPYVAEAQYALSQALYCYSTGNRLQMDRIMRHELPVKSFQVNDEGTMALSIDQGNTVYVWNLENGEKLAQIAPKIVAQGYVADLKGAMVLGEHIILCEEKNLRSVDFAGQEEWNTELSSGAIYCGFDEAAALAACVSGGEVLFYDITNGEKIAVMPNMQEASYTSTMAFNEDASKIAVAHLVMEKGDREGCISVYDFETRTVTDVATQATYIFDIAFTTDDNLVVAEAMHDDLNDSNRSEATGYLQKLNYRDGTSLWQNSYEYQVIGSESAAARIKCRRYEDRTTGEVHDEILMSADNVAYTWDNVTGEQIAEVWVDSSIMTLLAAENDSYAYLAEKNGIIDITDMTSGIRYSGIAIETGKELRDIVIRNEILTMRAYASPDLTVMKYHEGAGMTALEYYENAVKDVEYSGEETYYGITLYGNNSEKEIIRFYRTEDNSFVGEWMEEEGGLADAAGFVNDTLYVEACMDGNIIFYDVESGEKETVTALEGYATVECNMNEEHTFAFFYGGQDYAVVDLLQKKLLYTGKVEGYFRGGVLSADGRYAYCCIKEIGVCILDAKAGTVMPVELEEYQVLSNAETQDAFAVSKNGKLLAVSCSDGVLRVLDLTRMETVAEIPFAAIYRRFIEFSENDTQIMLQGDDYYFKVFDLKKGEFVHISANQYYEIKRVVMDEESDTISLITLVNMLILNRADYERVAQVDGGKAYLPEHARIFLNQGRQMYQFPYMTLDMLRTQAEEQFGGERLTELEKTRFHVE